MAKFSRRDFLKMSGQALATGAMAYNGLSPNKTEAAQGGNSGTAQGAGDILSLPKGGGAIKGIGETFQPNLFTGTANFSVPIGTSPGREGFGPELSLQYSSGNGNGPFGLGHSLSIPSITRKTEKGLPQYNEEDVFVLSGAEDLVEHADFPARKEGSYTVTTYRPRVEGLFARIEKWEHGGGSNNDNLSKVFWKITTKENITSLYGRTNQAILAQPTSSHKIFQWFLEFTYDPKGNVVHYEYKHEDGENILEAVYEKNREDSQNYLKRIRYGNLIPFNSRDSNAAEKILTNPIVDIDYFFMVVFDYGEHGVSKGQDELITEDIYKETKQWESRPDPFSSYRAGFEIRTHRRCKRVLMFHNAIPGEPEPVLVKSTDFLYRQNSDNLISLLVGVTQRGYQKAKTKGAFQSEDIELGEPGVHSTVYEIKCIPRLDFGYSEFKPKEQKLTSFDAQGGDLPPRGLNAPKFSLVDLFGSGLPDVLQTEPNGYYYWRNLGTGRFSGRKKLKNSPAGVTLDQDGIGFGDMAGNGQADLLVHKGSSWGFYESTNQGGWENFHTYKAFPSFNLNDPNLRLVDLTGNGKADALRTDDRSFTWFPCLGEDGFGKPRIIGRKSVHNDFPNIFFSDPRVRLADMTGDGMKDIVRVFSGRIDYWPNLGYGRFGKRITMMNAPHLGKLLDPNRLIFLDIDGSGPSDLVYVDQEKVRFWFNRSGNGWSDENAINGVPRITNLDSIQLADMLGNGTSGILWSKDFRNPGQSNYYFLDFTGGEKPYVMTEITNNMGATTRNKFTTSTKFYLEDKKNGEPWVTHLPFPVQVLEKTEVIDHIGKTKLVTTYKYHHGYFDGREREFRGFGRVDQYDTEKFEDFSSSSLHGDTNQFENKDKAFHVPPVLTKTWFHTGVYFDKDNLSPSGIVYDHNDLSKAFQREFFANDKFAFELLNHLIETANTPHEAYRALRGSIIRTEVYGLDDTDKSGYPYLATENRFEVKLLQPGKEKNQAVYLSVRKENLNYHYERNPRDPRIDHQITLSFDDFGNITESVSIAYPRRPPDKPFFDESGSPILDDEKQPIPPYPEQRNTKATYTFARFINKYDDIDFYYAGVPCETKTFEVHGVKWYWPNNKEKIKTFPIPISPKYFKDLKNPNEYEAFENDPPEDLASPRKRLIEWARHYFRSDKDPDLIDSIGDTSHRLKFGEIQSLGLTYESYQVAFTQSYMDKLYPKKLSDEFLENEGGYHKEIPQDSETNFDSNIRNYWWIPSGRTAVNPKLFYQIVQDQDPFGNLTKVNFDEFGLLVRSTQDPLENKWEAENDYRTLQPFQLTDPNDNRKRVAFDALGMVIGTAIMGKKDENLGDSLEGFNENLSINEIQKHINDPLERPNLILQNSTSRIVYDFHQFSRKKKPNVVVNLQREIHSFDKNIVNGKIQQKLVYFDGQGREIQTKVPAPSQKNGLPFWISSSTKVYNNKGKPTQQFEPFYTNTHIFKHQKNGISPIIFYDPLERIVCTLNSNHTYAKVVFNPWKEETWDLNDTIHPYERFNPKKNIQPSSRFDPINDNDVGHYFKSLHEDRYLPTWYDLRMDQEKAVNKWPEKNDKGEVILKNKIFRLAEMESAISAAKHSATPSIEHLDEMGRPFLNAADNGMDEKGENIIYFTQKNLDIKRNEKVIRDPRGVKLFKHFFDLSNRKIIIESSDSGTRIVFPNVLNKSILSIDGNDSQLKTTYDKLHRPVELWVEKKGVLFLAEKTIYGESERTNINSKAKNLRGRIFKNFDQSGIIQNAEYDFKGNLITTRRKFIVNYDSQKIDWVETSKIPLEKEEFTTTNAYDAFNRITKTIYPDDSSQNFIFNETGLLNKINLNINGEGKVRGIIAGINYNAKGQRKKIFYGEKKFSTTFEYDPNTFRLIGIETIQKGKSQKLQDLLYVYDPNGNICQIRNNLKKPVYFANTKVEDVRKFIYDPLGRLVQAKGREHAGIATKAERGHIDIPRKKFSNKDLKALQNYTETYAYDGSDNMISVIHESGKTRWKRLIHHEKPSKSNAGSNRLSSRNNLVNGGGQDLELYSHDQNGNILNMPHLNQNSSLKWDFKNQLNQIEPTATRRIYYQYGGGLKRIRKVVTENNRVEERVYVGGYESYIKKINGNNKLQNTSFNIMSGKQRVAIIESTNSSDKNKPKAQKFLVRYQINDHLGSSSIEADENGDPFSYEEYYPYGQTSFHSRKGESGSINKRYRFSGKEKDSETGLYYFGARYYCSWIGRWISPDPGGSVDGLNLYSFSRNNPIRMVDLDGFNSVPANEGSNVQGEIDINDKAASDGSKEGLFISANLDMGKSMVKSEARSRFFKKFAENISTPLNEIRKEYKFKVKENSEYIASLVKRKLVPFEPGAKHANGFRKAAKSYARQKTPLPIRKILDLFDWARSGNPLGKSFDELTKTKSFAHIIKSSGRTNAFVNNFTKYFDAGVKGAGKYGGLLGVFSTGQDIGKGVDQILMGKTSSGIQNITSNGLLLALDFASVAAVAAGTVTAGVATVGTVIASSSIFLATETIDSAQEGRITPIEVMDNAYGTHFGDIIGWVKGDYN
jgi:RHS repeat-associated protein